MTKATSWVCVCIMEKTKRMGKDDGKEERACSLVPSFLGKNFNKSAKVKSRLCARGQEQGDGRRSRKNELAETRCCFRLKGRK